MLLYLAKPFTKIIKEKTLQLAKQLGVESLEESYPVSFIGTGANKSK